MIKVDEIYPISLNTTIGPTGTIKRLFRNRDYFASRGYELNVFVPQTLVQDNKVVHKFSLLEKIPEDENKRVSSNQHGIKGKIISKVKPKVFNSSLLSQLFLWRRNRGYANCVQQYLSFDRQSDVTVFHEAIGCYHFLKERKNNSKVVLFIHADGDKDAMILRSIPKLRGTYYFKKYTRMTQYALENCDRIVFISEIAQNKFIGNHPEINPKKTTFFHNGIDDLPFKTVSPMNEYKYRLASTGSLTHRKGQYLIIEALNQMNPTLLKDIYLSIYGNGEDYQELVHKVKEYGLQEHVDLPGSIPNLLVHEKLLKSNIYILMSNTEGLPISILEAMRAGMGVISTNVAGIPEEVDERNGILINPDLQELINVLNNIDQYDWENMGKMSRLRFEEEYTFDVMRKNYADMFDSVLQVI